MTIRQRIVAFLNARRKALAPVIATALTWLIAKVGLDKLGIHVTDAEILVAAPVISAVVVNFVANVVRRAKVSVLDTRV